MTTHRERMETCLAGQNPDRPPVALWRHFPVDDQSPQMLATAVLHWQKTFDWDFVKVTPSASYAVRDWGVDDQWQGDSEGTRRFTHRAIYSIDDWANLGVLDADSPSLSAQLNCLAILRSQLGPDVPLVQTIFSPLSQAKNLAGTETFMAHLRMKPEIIGRALEIIAESTRRFIRAARAHGLIDGVFYAVQHAQAGILSKNEFIEFGRAYDLLVLESARPLWLNILHAHGENIYFNNLADYPVQVINWDDQLTAPSLSEAQTRTRSALCGGIKRDTIVYGSPAEIKDEIIHAIDETAGRRLILGAGCVIPVTAPYGNLLAVRTGVEK